jgi:adenylate cyclase
VSDRARNRIAKSFTLYLTPTVIERMLAGDRLPELGAESRELTVLFSDIAGYGEISESLSSAELVACLNRYLAVMSDTIEARGGFADKYIGDAVVAVFGGPVDDENHALSAVRAALACHRKPAAEASGFGLPGGRAVETLIGLNTGEMLVGNIGSPRHFKTTVLGCYEFGGTVRKCQQTIRVANSSQRPCHDALWCRDLISRL